MLKHLKKGLGFKVRTEYRAVFVGYKKAVVFTSKRKLDTFKRSLRDASNLPEITYVRRTYFDNRIDDEVIQ